VASQTSGSLLLLSAIGVIIPTAAERLGTGSVSLAAADLIAEGMADDKVMCFHLLPMLWTYHHQPGADVRVEQVPMS